ncbi:MAG: hypothetical protein OET90_00005, partial [Desulfuromonadales bacterium]|nr:hypothetical protein [Desulfuromonadales bacterium]
MQITCKISGLCLSFLLIASISFAETVPGTNFSVHFESANIIGTGRTVNMHRVPVVVNSTGATAYYDVSFEFKVDGSGNLVFDRTSSIASPTLGSADNFIPGVYVDTAGNQYRVSGGGTTHGRAHWNIMSITSEIDFYATWVTGSPAGHPLISERSPSGSLYNEGTSYGVVGVSSFSDIPSSDSGRNIISAAQGGRS